MKRYAVLFGLMVLMAITTSAQAEYRLSKVGAAHGRTAFASGLVASVKFTDETRSFSLQANDVFIGVTHNWDLGAVSTAATGGLFNNTPWTGPMVSVDWTPYLATTNWFAWMSGAPGLTEWDPQFFFSYHSVALTLGQLEVGDAMLHIQHNLMRQVPWASYTVRINGRFTVAPTVTWDIRRDELLYQVAVTWKPATK